MDLFLDLIVFILGLCIGSFLNVVSDRLPRGKSLGGRSVCDHCKKTLSPFDLVPVFSYLFLLGKCRYCKKKIPFRYTLVEVLTGIVFVFLYMIFPPDISFFSVVALCSLLVIYASLIAILFSDLRYRIIPDELVFMFLVGTVLYRSIGNMLTIEAVASGFVLCIMFLGLYVVTRGRGMGMGDVKYALPMGFFLGYPNVIVGFYVAFLTGAMVSIILILGGKKRFGQTIAFGPFLVIATVISHIYGNALWFFFQRIVGL